jgi:ATP-dependent DNA helicase RecQ
MQSLVKKHLINDLETLISNKEYEKAQLFAKALASIYHKLIFFEYYAYTVLCLKNRKQGILWLTKISEDIDNKDIQKQVIKLKDDLEIKKKQNVKKAKKAEITNSINRTKTNDPVLKKTKLEVMDEVINVTVLTEQIVKKINLILKNKELLNDPLNISNFKTEGGDILQSDYKHYFIKYYAIFDYYPKSRFQNVDDNIKKIRDLVYTFKDGKAKNEALVNKLCLLIKTVNIPLEDSYRVPMPASTMKKTKNRYEIFCSLLSEKLSIKNGYNLITTKDHEPTKGQAGGDKIGNFNFENGTNIFRNRNIILFDDVRTSGTTFKQVATKLLNSGAKSVTGLFLAKTVSDSEEVWRREGI